MDCSQSKNEDVKQCLTLGTGDDTSLQQDSFLYLYSFVDVVSIPSLEMCRAKTICKSDFGNII